MDNDLAVYLESQEPQPEPYTECDYWRMFIGDYFEDAPYPYDDGDIPF
jgi:hypothetical protein